MSKSTTIKPKPKVAPNIAHVSKRRKKRKKKKKGNPETKEQKLQKKEIRNLMANIGFSALPQIDGTHFKFDERTSELDDIFVFENIVVLAEYTTDVKPGDHLKNKKIIYDKINSNPKDFINFFLKEKGFRKASSFLNKSILKKYTVNQLQVRTLYASRQTITQDHKVLVKNVVYFDYAIVKYFESVSKIIKISAKHEFFNFLDIENSKIGENILQTSKKSDDEFSGHILPEEHSSFSEGYKLVSFYIDANSLLRRAYVLRRDGWRNKDNIALYQRMFLPKKIKSMRKYLHEEGRVFINNIIVTLPVDKIKLSDEKKNELKLDNKGQFIGEKGKTNVTPATITIEDNTNIIGIIDGQHRCYAYHEGNDIYEKTIEKLRKIQNLLITGILYPKQEPDAKRLKFEAQLFLEINSTQAGASSQLKQEIEFMMNPFSTIAISKHIINQLNQSGPLSGLFEEFWFEKSKLKTASIISFALKPLVKFEGNDTLFKIWKGKNKKNLSTTKDDYVVLSKYKEFCTTQVRDVFIGLRQNIDINNWKIDRSDPNAMLTVTTINGIINCLRLLIQNNNAGDINYYKNGFAKIIRFNFKNYKSSQYRKMGEDIYNLCFKM
jgi:DGQHR domain-containing protein